MFSDDAVLELIARTPDSDGPSLLLWKNNVVTIASEVEYAGKRYQAPELEAVLYSALRLPSGCEEYGSTRNLISDLAELVTQYFPSPAHYAELLARFTVCTWLSDRLAVAPVLLITGVNESAAINLLHLLHCLCRHGLLLAEISSATLHKLPRQLSLTLLLSQFEMRPTLERTIRASSYRGLHLLGSRGTVVDPFGAKAIYCRNAAALDVLTSGVIHIPLPPPYSPPLILDEERMNQISSRFQPRLLLYRMRNLSKAGNCQENFVDFTLATRQLATNLAMCTPDDDQLVAQTAELLRPQDEEVRAKRFFDLKYVLVEILWGFLHEGTKRKIAVRELTKYANALLHSRGELREYTPEEVGGRLSDSGIRRHRSSAGQHVFLDHETSETIHKLAPEYGVQTTPGSHPSCRECGGDHRANSSDVS